MKRIEDLKWAGLLHALAVWTLVLGSGSTLVAQSASSGAKRSQNPAAKLTIDDSPLSREIRAATSFAPVVKKVATSVVNIYSTTTVREPMDPFFRHFFGDPSGRQGRSRAHKEQGLGSGVIVSPEGYILTANHVVEGADSVKVGLASGEKEFDAKVIGTDPPTDIAVLKIDAKKLLAAVTLADSDKLEVGDVVLAVGNPFAVGQTVTMGIVSAMSRGGLGISGYEDFIQTDAAINPGNSGGALVDVQGRLVGINTAILSGSGGYQGVGFAVPINMARFVMDRLILEGRVSRGYLGIRLESLTPSLAKAFGLPEDTTGVLVEEVTPESAAAKAGMEDGDVITEFSGRKVVDRRNLQLIVAQTPPGTKVSVRILRGKPGHKLAEETLTAKLGELPEEALASASGARSAPKERSPSKFDALDGVEVQDLDSRMRRQLEIPSNVRGALVSNVEPESNAAEAGLRPGAVIIEIDRQPVADAEAAVALSEKAKGEQILLRIWTQGGGARYLPVDNLKRK
jgi:serine protease Do